MFTRKQTGQMISLLAIVFILFAVSCNNNKTGEGTSAQAGKKYIRYNAYDPRPQSFLVI
jgi:hypothetical protein